MATGVVFDDEPRHQSFMQVPVNALMDHNDAGKQLSEDFLLFLKVHADSEELAASQLLRALKTESLFPAPSESPNCLEKAAHALRSFLGGVMRSHGRYSKLCDDEIRKPLETILGVEWSRHTRIKTDWNRIVKGYIACRDKVQKTKKALSKAIEDHRAALNISAMATERRGPSFTDVDKVKARVQKAQEVKRQAEMAERESVKVLQQCIADRDGFIRDACRAYQQMEEERVGRVRDAMLRLAALEREHLQARLVEVEAFESVVRSLDVRQDVDRFISERRDPDATHLYHRALVILEWAWLRQLRLRRKQQQAGGGAGGDARPATPQPPGEEGEEGGSPSPSFLREKSGIDAILANLLSSSPSSASGDGGGGATMVAEPGRITSPGPEPSPTGNGGAGLADVPFSELIEHERGRAYFIQVLNEGRGRHTDVGSGYDGLSRCLEQLLDKCLEKYDVRAAQQTMQMAHTFFRSTSTGVTSPSSEAGLTSQEKEYLLTRIRSHPIWRSHKLWEDALMLGVADQFDLCPQPASWDNLPGEALREAVITVHNTVFGQLGSLAFNMSECGVPAGEIQSFIRNMCERTQLGEDQVLQLEAILRSLLKPPPPPHDQEEGGGGGGSLGVVAEDEEGGSSKAVR